MKKLLAFMLALCMVFSMLPPAAAAETTEVDSGTCGENLTWVLDEDGLLTVSGEGAMKDYTMPQYVPWYKYRNQISTLRVQEGVTSLGDYSFYNIVKLNEVRLPESLERIGIVALAGTSLSYLYIPSGVTEIGPEAFGGNSSMGYFAVSEDNATFSNDESGVLFNKDKTQLLRCPQKFEGAYVIPETVEFVGEKAFERCQKLTEVTIPGSVKELSRHAFASCTALETVHLQEGLEVIGNEAFMLSTALSGKLTIPSSVTKLGNSAFDMTELTEICFLGDMPEIAEYAFSGIALTVYYPANNPTWTEEKIESVKGLSTFVPYDTMEEVASGTWGDNITWSLTSDGTLTVSGEGEVQERSGGNPYPWEVYADQITTVMVEDGITGEIKGFDMLENLTSVYLSKDITSIARGAFAACPNLIEITFPEALESMGSYAFQGCVSLKEVHLPATLSSGMGARPFGGCTNLTGIWVDEANPYFANDEYGVLFSKDMTQLVEAPGALSGHYTIPETVNYIEWAAFDGCKGLTGVDIPNGVTMLQMNLFENCTSLKSIIIPASVSDVWIHVFMGCTALETVTFEGDAPRLDNAFEGLTFTAYYPASNPTWTEEVMASAGGNITWVPYEIVTEVACGTWGDNITWSLTSDGTLTVSGEGDAREVGSASSYPWYAYANQIRTVIFEEGVTNVPEYAFYYAYPNLTAVELKSVTVISYAAFQQCSALTNVTLPDTLKEIRNGAFSHTALNAVEIHEGVTMIGINAFCGTNLTEIILPEGVEFLGDGVFWDCKQLKSAYLPDSITGIGMYLFFGCTALETANIPTGLISVPDGMFVGCSSLKSIEIPNGITIIGMSNFEETGLTSVTIPASVTYMGSPFRNCTDLKEVFFEGDAPTIGNGCFTGVTATAYYPAGNATWTEDKLQDYGGNITWVPYRAERNVIAEGYSGYTTWVLTDDCRLTISGSGDMRNYTNKTAMPWYDYIDQIKSIRINEGVTSIGDYAFYGMGITTVEIADSVTRIGDYAFKNADKLTFMELPSGLTYLGESAFYGCSNLTTVEIPATLWTIRPYTFKNCTVLNSVTFHEGNLQKISDGAFYNTGLRSVTLPDCLDILDVYAFKNCNSLITVKLGSGLTEIREAVFYGTWVNSIEIPEGITAIGPYAFKNCTSLRSVTFGAGLTTIGESSFYGCTGLTQLELPENVHTVGAYAFKSCTGLERLTLSDNLNTLGDSALHGCTALRSLTIPENVQTLGDYCLARSGLTEITFLGTTAPGIGVGAFNQLTATVYYPAENVNWDSGVRDMSYGGSITWIAY